MREWSLNTVSASSRQSSGLVNSAVTTWFTKPYYLLPSGTLFRDHSWLKVFFCSTEIIPGRARNGSANGFVNDNAVRLWILVWICVHTLLQIEMSWRTNNMIHKAVRLPVVIRDALQRLFSHSWLKRFFCSTGITPDETQNGSAGSFVNYTVTKPLALWFLVIP